jgi:hypothetical protein
MKARFMLPSSRTTARRGPLSQAALAALALLGLTAGHAAHAQAAPGYTFQTIADFNHTNGAYPLAALTDVNGTLYGTTVYGGANGYERSANGYERSGSGYGTVFSLKLPTNATVAPEPSALAPFIFAALGLGGLALRAKMRRTAR